MEKQVRTHRVGSFTAGISMIVLGVLFILRLFTDFRSGDHRNSETYLTLRLPETRWVTHRTLSHIV